jgi:hypothetical protein
MTQDTRQSRAVADAAVYFDDPEFAYDALVAWRRARSRLDARRDPLVLGALRVFPKHGREALAVRATGLSRNTIRRIAEAGQDSPAVTRPHFPDLILYAEVLLVESDRLAPPPGAEPETTEQYDLRRTQQAVLNSLADRILNVPVDDADLQALAADLLLEAAEMRSGVIDTYHGSLRRSDDGRADAAVAGLLESAAEQITQYRLRGDDATQDLNPAAVAEAQQRLDKRAHDTLVQAAGNDRYAGAIRSGKLVHGSTARDAAASAVLRAAQRMAELEQEMAQVRRDLLEPSCEPEESAEEPLPEALRAVADSDPEVREALVRVLGPEAATQFLAGQEDVA